MDMFFHILSKFDAFFWSYVGFTLVTLVGIYFTVLSKGLQFKILYNFKIELKKLFLESNQKTKQNYGVNPFKIYFASVGGMIGLGNITSIGTAVTIGGPGSLFWVWIASIFGMLLKYSEIYLGIKYRVTNQFGSYDGGPMYYLQHAFKSTKLIPTFVALLLCIYGVEVYQFSVLVERMQTTFSLSKYLVIFLLLVLVIYSSNGGIARLANICSVIMPVFMGFYIFIGLYVIICNYHTIPTLIYSVFESAFVGHAPIGGFAGSSMLLAAYSGTSKAIYSGDIGIGYDSVVQSETSFSGGREQAKLAVYALFSDTLICTITMLTLLSSGAWCNYSDMKPSELMGFVLNQYIPYFDMQIFMTLVLFLAGFTTITAYLTVGVKSARFISPTYGKVLYILYALCAFTLFSNFAEEKTILIMNSSGGLLVLFNIIGIVLLRKKIDFKFN